jgi:hypothetical protein
MQVTNGDYSHKARTGWQYASVPAKVTRKDAHVTASRHQTVILMGFLIEAIRLIVMHTEDLTVASATTYTRIQIR